MPKRVFTLRDRPHLDPRTVEADRFRVVDGALIFYNVLGEGFLALAPGQWITVCEKCPQEEDITT